MTPVIQKIYDNIMADNIHMLGKIYTYVVADAASQIFHVLLFGDHTHIVYHQVTPSESLTSQHRTKVRTNQKTYQNLMLSMLTLVYFLRIDTLKSVQIYNVRSFV